jgi:two-component system KDP operon response regulator KdpE
MSKSSGTKARGTAVKSAADGHILQVGAGRFGVGLKFTQFERFKVEPQEIEVKASDSLGSTADLDEMSPPSLVILGLSQGVEQFLVSIRQVWPYSTVIIAADESRLSEVYSLLASGATDYIPLSASQREIEEKCLIHLGAYQARMKRSARSFGPLTVNFAQRMVTNGKEDAHLTPIEMRILRTLLDHLGGVVERNVMKQLCWGDTEITDNALNRKIYEVRRTLNRLSDDVNIRTIYGLGFELRVG